VERGAMLGWELTRARRMFVDLPALASGETARAAAQALLRALEPLRGAEAGTIDPAAAALGLDRWMEEAGVDVYFKSWPVALRTAPDPAANGLRTCGLNAAAKSGRFALAAPVVVDTDAAARISRQWLTAATQPAGEERAVHVMLWSGTTLDAPTTVRLELGELSCEVRLRPTTWPGEAHADVELRAQDDGSGRACTDEAAFAPHAFAIAEALRQACPPLADGFVSHLGDASWGAPPFALDPVGSDLPPGFVPAGPWLAGAGIPYDDDHAAIGELLAAGERAARRALAFAP
ncbi:hypothetical protein IDH44_12125, partial [Paenibacillus sp. IB182496]